MIMTSTTTERIDDQRSSTHCRICDRVLRSRHRPEHDGEPHWGRGLCRRCYYRAQRAATLDNHPRITVPLHDVITLYRTTRSPRLRRQVLADTLGMRLTALDAALARARRLGLLPRAGTWL